MASRAQSGTFPRIIRLTSLVSEVRRRCPASDVDCEISCCRCRGLMPSRPPDVPDDMDLRDVEVSSESTVGARLSSTVECAGRFSSSGAAGCFSLSCCVTSAEGVIIVSSDVRILRAALISPSAHFEPILLPRCSLGSDRRMGISGSGRVGSCAVGPPFLAVGGFGAVGSAFLICSRI